jgi:hypothetical protein
MTRGLRLFGAVLFVEQDWYLVEFPFFRAIFLFRSMYFSDHFQTIFKYTVYFVSIRVCSGWSIDVVRRHIRGD